MEAITDYDRIRKEVWDPITGWRPHQIHTDVVPLFKRISGGSASQVLGSYRIPAGTFGLLRFLEITGNRAVEWNITDNRGTVWASQLPGGARVTYDPSSPQGIVRGAFSGTFVIRARNSAAGTFTSTFDFLLVSPSSYLTGTQDIRRA